MAFLKGSFYEKLSRFLPDAEGRSFFKGVRARPIADPEPILEHTVAIKDRADSLAHNYYSDSREWRRIADANPDTLFFEDALYDPEPVDDDGAPLSEDVNGRERLGNILLIPRRREVR